MWGFFILGSVYVEAFGLLVDHDFHIPFVGRWDALGFLQDFFAVAVLLGIITFAIIRIVREPKKHGRDSRFYGSHTGGAWLILFMIFNVIWTYALVRGAGGEHRRPALRQRRVLLALHGLAHASARRTPPTSGSRRSRCSRTSAVMLVFLLIVLHSKHLHIGLAPVNVTFKRMPNGLGPLLPVEYKGSRRLRGSRRGCGAGPRQDRGLHLEGLPRLHHVHRVRALPVAVPGVEHRQAAVSQARDHEPSRPPVRQGAVHPRRQGDRRWRTPQKVASARTSAARSTTRSTTFPSRASSASWARVPSRPHARWSAPLEQGGVIDPDVLWSCTTCGACVEQCPVDIEHIDHIVDMRRYQVMMESEFPGELGVLFKNLENKGNPWGQNSKDRTNWIDEVEFDVPVYGKDVESFEGYEYLFWVGCAGAYEDRAKKTTKAVAELLATAGVKYLVLGEGETCNGDSARRSGNEFLFQQLAAQNVETLNELFEGVERVDRKVVVTCPHCFNTLGREYPQVGGNYTVLHHTQLLNRLIRDKKLVPVKPVDGGSGRHHLPRPLLPGPAQQGLRGAA